MAYKLMHRTMTQVLRFPTRAAAHRYAEHDGGGRDRWHIAVAGLDASTAPTPTPDAPCTPDRPPLLDD